MPGGVATPIMTEHSGAGAGTVAGAAGVAQVVIADPSGIGVTAVCSHSAKSSPDKRRGSPPPKVESSPVLSAATLTLRQNPSLPRGGKPRQIAWPLLPA